MMSDTKTIDTDLKAFTAPLKDGQSSTDHDSWMKAQIRKTLARKKAGTMTYRSLDKVMQKFGSNAR